MLFVMMGMWRAFAVPASLDANSVFRMSAERDAAACHAGTRRAAAVMALAPTALALWPIASAASVWVLLGHLVFCAAWAVLSVELLFGRLPKIPFTCAYDPGGSNLRVHWASYALGALSYVTLAVVVEQRMLRGPEAFAAGLFCLGIALWIARRRRDAAREQDGIRRSRIIEWVDHERIETTIAPPGSTAREGRQERDAEAGGGHRVRERPCAGLARVMDGDERRKVDRRTAVAFVHRPSPRPPRLSPVPSPCRCTLAPLC